MGIGDLIARDSIEKGLVAKFDRANRFRIVRTKNDHGFFLFILENQGREERIIIRQFIFDRFRAAVASAANAESNERTPGQFESEITYKGIPYYRIQRHHSDPGEIVIRDLKAKRQEQSTLTFHAKAIGTLLELLFHKKIHHCHEALARVIAYHKLFQFTFAEGSESITSDLAIRHGVLASIETYVPTLAQKDDGSFLDKVSYDSDGSNGKKAQVGTGKRDTEQHLFKSRLAEKSADKSYHVNFSELFKNGSAAAERAVNAGVEKSRKRAGEVAYFQLPILANDVKTFAKTPFKCEFSTEDITELRETFLGDRSMDLYLGFEILDAVHRREFGRLKTLKFPLYYMKVKVIESGRTILIEPDDGGQVFLNHLALANLIESHAKQSAGHDRLHEFFSTMLAQSFEVGSDMTRIYVTRALPFSEIVFQKTREILLGFPGENGKGGLLAGLNVLGIECDLESVCLYKVPRVSAHTTVALERDLDQILHLARQETMRFNRSLLGQFLMPELRSEAGVDHAFGGRLWIPGGMPKSTKRLLGRLESSDLTLLEGPPGTGKTFTILNLFLHCLCSGKRLLIVSDQKAAIHALTEKIVEYLVGKDRISAAGKGIIQVFEGAIKVVDSIPEREDSLGNWVQQLRDSLKIDSPSNGAQTEDSTDLALRLAKIDDEMQRVKDIIQSQLELRMGSDASMASRIRAKRFHPTTARDIESLCDFLRFFSQRTVEADGQVMSDASNLAHLELFIENRKKLAQGNLVSCYDFFKVTDQGKASDDLELQSVEDFLNRLAKQLPRSEEAFHELLRSCPNSLIERYLATEWESAFPRDASAPAHGLRVVKSLFAHPLKQKARDLRVMISFQRHLCKAIGDKPSGVRIELTRIHDALQPDSTSVGPLSLEIAYSMLSKARGEGHGRERIDLSIHENLERLEALQESRDVVVRARVLASMAGIIRRASAIDANGGTNLVTSIAASLDALKAQKDLDDGLAFHRDLQQRLIAAFPVWICRKQAIPFLFPCTEELFDLVIVDEATQCRVDDALPLLFRAKKILVVGDEKQTVLAKDSVLDDYLFREFSLEEHLRQTQARGIKGGGSHLFALIKGIKQAHVMLDEHYRCPPDIIQYSNQYVYHNELRYMQWDASETHRSIEVDYSEENVRDSGRRESGQFKGIETDMIDRFLDYVERTIPKIEKEIGEKLNVETDVALCYFLLKNEPYIKRMKPEFLQRLGRGQEILDGAGAALQGKERDYIFYFWDVNRGNMTSFRQGDDVDKRRGELNVLMSRPKKRAYHYLHKDFRVLEHSKASITDFLWKAYNRQSHREARDTFKPRVFNPGAEFVPWRRSSGQLMAAIVDQYVRPFAGQEKSSKRGAEFNKRFSITVGDPQFCVDLMLIRGAKHADEVRAIGLVDLSAFGAEASSVDELVDYFFQLRRATPKIQPVFLFVHELANPKSRAFQKFMKILESLRGSGRGNVAA